LISAVDSLGLSRTRNSRLDLILSSRTDVIILLNETTVIVIEWNG
jgi:hypothetical protein